VIIITSGECGGGAYARHCPGWGKTLHQIKKSQRGSEINWEKKGGEETEGGGGGGQLRVTSMRLSGGGRHQGSKLKMETAGQGTRGDYPNCGPRS